MFSAIAPALLLMALALSAISEAFEDMSSEFLEIFSAFESICAANESAEPPEVIFSASIAALLADMDFVFSEMADLFAFIDSLFSAIFPSITFWRLSIRSEYVFLLKLFLH